VGAPRRCREPRGCDVVDAVVSLVGNLAPDMRNAGEMHDGINACERCIPVGRVGKIGERDDLDAVVEWRLWRLPHRGAHAHAAADQRWDERPADESGGSGDEKARHVLLRAKSASSAITAPAPTMSAAIAAARVGIATVPAASTTSAMLTANTRRMTCGTLRPLSSAR